MTMDETEIMAWRRMLLDLKQREGIKAVKRLAKRLGEEERNIIQLMRPVYGIPSAGHSYGQLLIRRLTMPAPKGMAMQRSHVDGCV